MTPELKAEINAAHDRLAQLEHEGRFDEADEYLKNNRWIFSHDRKGNWIGSVANEDGWTA